MGKAPKVVTRDQLLEELWDDQAFVDENTLNVNMTRVRKKLADYEIVFNQLKQFEEQDIALLLSAEEM